MEGPSRSALAQLRDDLARVPAADRRTAAEDLFAVRDLVAGSISLSRALTDPAASTQVRRGLLGRLVGDKIGAAARGLAEAAVAARWSRSRDLAVALEQLGADAVLGVAEAAGRLDAVEDDLFRFGRIVERSPALSLALSDPATTAAGKADLVGRLLAGKADADAVLLIRRAVTAPGGLPLERALAELVALAAGRRMQLVADVRSARPLTDAQTGRLAAALRDLYGRNVRVQSDVDPTLIGGLTVHVGDEVIDGSMLRRLAEARASLTR